MVGQGVTEIAGMASSHRSGSLSLGPHLQTTWGQRVASHQGTPGYTGSTLVGSRNSTTPAGARTVVPPPEGRGRQGASPPGTGEHRGSSPGQTRNNTRWGG